MRPAYPRGWGQTSAARGRGGVASRLHGAGCGQAIRQAERDGTRHHHHRRRGHGRHWRQWRWRGLGRLCAGSHATGRHLSAGVYGGVPGRRLHDRLQNHLLQGCTPVLPRGFCVPSGLRIPRVLWRDPHLPQCLRLWDQVRRLLQLQAVRGHLRGGLVHDGLRLGQRSVPQRRADVRGWAVRGHLRQRHELPGRDVWIFVLLQPLHLSRASWVVARPPFERR
jgi:hypothetical protein